MNYHRIFVGAWIALLYLAVYTHNYRRSVGSVVLKISYGYEVKETCDPLVELAERATEQFSIATAPGGHLVDVIPARKHIV